MNRASRLAVVALLTGTTAVVAGTQQASAATDWYWCDGKIVTTCIELQVDGSEAKAVATIRDVEGGTNFLVDATHAILQLFNPDSRTWENVRFNFQPHLEFTRDEVVTSWGSCGGHGSRKFRAVGYYKWVNPQGLEVSDSMTSSEHFVDCRP